MKKTLMLLVAVVVGGSVSADIVQFKWGNGSASDGVVGGQDVLTYLDSNANGSILDYVTAGEIGVADLQLFNGGAYATVAAVLVPFGPAVGQWGTAYMTDLAAAGSGAYAITGLDFGSALEGQTFLVSGTQGVVDLRPSGSGTAALPQDFVLGATTTVTVIPEPATLGLMGIAGLGMFLARKKARR